MSDLLALAERCEKAEGPDRLLSQAIAEAVGWKCDLGTNWARESASVWWRDPGGNTRDLPDFSASLDAALSLVPEGCAPMQDWHHLRDDLPGVLVWECYVQQVSDGHTIGSADAGTPALAMAAAALRARAAQC